MVRPSLAADCCSTAPAKRRAAALHPRTCRLCSRLCPGLCLLTATRSLPPELPPTHCSSLTRFPFVRCWQADTSGQAEQFNSDLLRFYYARLFPYSPYYNWLSYGYGTVSHCVRCVPARCLLARGALTVWNDFQMRTATMR